MDYQARNGRDKIQDLEALAGQLESVRLQGKKVVHCHGVFDLLHIGHIRHFEQAKSMGDVLVVTVTPDRYVNKGPHRPAFTESLRAEAIAALVCVDHVAITKWPTGVETINLLKPAVYVKGSDYKDATNDLTGMIVEEEAAVKSVGGQIAFTDDIVFSSSSLINKHLPVLPKEASEYLPRFSERYSAKDVLGYLETSRALKVLVVGETIIDEYQYCETIGKSTKEPILAARYLSTEKFAGGIVAVANHVANFCDNVSVATTLGDHDSQEEFIRQHLNKKVGTRFLYKAHSPTIVKRRFVEETHLQKIFEMYEINDDELDESQSKSFCAWLDETTSGFDVVLVVDYGHGLMTKDAINLLCQKARFLAVNTQSNAGNRGFNTISRYPCADYVCLADHEINLEERNRNSDPREMILNVSRKLSCANVMVTRGREGNIGYRQGEGFVATPAFAHQVVDRMGAGDAVISLTTLYVAQDAPMDVVGFVGNVVGAQAVATVGHRTFIERVPLFRHIESLLK